MDDHTAAIKAGRKFDLGAAMKAAESKLIAACRAAETQKTDDLKIINDDVKALCTARNDLAEVKNAIEEVTLGNVGKYNASDLQDLMQGGIQPTKIY